MYVKLFKSIYDGSLRGKSDCLGVFIYLLANADSSGMVDIHPSKISDDTGIPLERTKAALLELEAPDPDSRTPDDEGRRVARLDEHRQWGWVIVNYEKYRQIRYAEERKEANRLYQRKSRERQTARKRQQMSDVSADVSIRQQISAMSAQAEAEEEAEEDTPLSSSDESLIVLREEKEVSDSTGSQEYFSGPVRKTPLQSHLPDPLEDFDQDVAAEARTFWEQYAMQHHGSALRNLHTESTYKELRHFAKAIQAFGDEAIAKLSDYYACPPKADKQLHAFQIIKKLGLEQDNEALSRSSKETTKKDRLKKILDKKPIDFG